MGGAPASTRVAVLVVWGGGYHAVGGKPVRFEEGGDFLKGAVAAKSDGLTFGHILRHLYSPESAWKEDSPKFVFSNLDITATSRGIPSRGQPSQCLEPQCLVAVDKYAEK